MIGIQLQGQLGNQLFQIAFIRHASGVLHEFYVIFDDKSYGCIAEKYFRLRFYEKRYFRKILKRLFPLTSSEIIEFNNWEDPKVILDSLKPDSIYKGFFQSDQFVNTLDIKKAFRIKKKYRELFFQKYGELIKSFKVVVIHIRLKDYLETGNEALGGKGLNLPFIYYQKAIEQLEFDDNTKVMVISDDTDYVKQNFKLNIPFSIEKNLPIIDFLLMVNANSLIISNSSFSWWGAFLNNKSDLKVIAPKYWLGFKVQKTYPVNIICSSWSTVSVV
jgi:hypothetical protein